MAYLNEAERDQLLDELKTMNFKRATSKLRRMDPKGKLAIYRNNQQTGEWVTRYDLVGLGTRVTLIEDRVIKKGERSDQNKYELARMVVEPMPGNRT